MSESEQPVTQTEDETLPTLPTRKRLPSQAALAEWFAQQRTGALDTVEAAAGQLITLSTGLLGLLLGLLALTDSPCPAIWPGRPSAGQAGPGCSC